MVKVKLYYALSQLAGQDWIQIQASDVSQLISQLCERYGSEFRSRLRSCMILVNGRNILHLKKYKTKISDQDRVDILPYVAGG